jgi:hypothetical protein
MVVDTLMIVNALGASSTIGRGAPEPDTPPGPGGDPRRGTLGTADPNGDPAMNRSDIHAELRRTQADFHDLVARASAQDLRRRSDGTRWTNRQLLWHMVFGFSSCAPCCRWCMRWDA